MSSQNPYVSAKCPECAASLPVSVLKGESASCPFCGAALLSATATTSQTARESTTTIATQMRLASAAERAGNPAEAYDYYTQVIVTDPDYVAAWYYRALAASQMSTLAAPRLAELSSGIREASDLVDAVGLRGLDFESADEFRISAASQIHRRTIDFASVARNHFKEFMGVGDAFESWIGHCVIVLDSLDVAVSICPLMENALKAVILKNEIDILSELLEGYDFGGVLRLRDEGRTFGITKRNRCIQQLQAIDPTYRSPTVTEPACFIATAAVGDGDAHVVQMLRDFRDTRLSRTRFGSWLIVGYYTWSPPLARFIARGRIRRLVTLATVVYPAYLVASLFTSRKQQ